MLAGLVTLVALLYVRMARHAGWSPDLADAAYAALPRSGVTNPVTAVILNYRAYDTFLELGVLTMVVLGILALMPRAERGPETARPRDVFLASYAQTLIPFMIVAAGYLLWVGAFRPGGAFQAGSILAGAGVLFLLARPRFQWRKAGTLQRVLVGGGFSLFGIAGLAVMASGKAFLEWPTAWAKWIILLIETAATLSIGFILTALFAACAGRLRLLKTRPGEAGAES
jgi:multisubunit Na+/H+ antiporter MnhB subunit